MTIEQTIAWHATPADRRPADPLLAAALGEGSPRHRASWGLTYIVDEDGSRWTWIPRRDRFKA